MKYRGRLQRAIAVDDFEHLAEVLAETVAARLGSAAEVVGVEGQLVAAEVVARHLSVKRERVYELARRGGDPLPSVSIGGAKRFALADVDDWVRRQT